MHDTELQVHVDLATTLSFEEQQRKYVDPTGVFLRLYGRSDEGVSVEVDTQVKVKVLRSNLVDVGKRRIVLNGRRDRRFVAGWLRGGSIIIASSEFRPQLVQIAPMIGIPGGSGDRLSQNVQR